MDPRLAGAVRALGFKSPYPPQEEALRKGLLAGKNMVISSPTSSGKTLIAEMAIVNAHNRDPTSKALYLVPLKALASEKFQSFTQSWSAFGLRVTMTTGDYDAKEERLGDYDVVIATNEKVDSVLRHRPSWLGDVSLVVADEIHTLALPDRGPTLEAVLTRLMTVLPKAQYLAMSATIGNPDELSEWLEAETVASDWRPVPLRIGTLEDGVLVFDDGSRREVCPNSAGHELECLAEDTLKEGGQFLVFANSRRISVKLARDLSKVTQGFAKASELTEYSSKALGNEQTELGKELSSLIGKGVAFHNAGLSPDQRRAVEDGFRAGAIKGIVATPTLAAGVNLPARRVIIPTLWRYEAGQGMVPLSVMEFRQLCGRAGRPQYDNYGEAVALVRPGQEEDFFETYVFSRPEPVVGRLLESETLSSQVLASIAAGYENTEVDLAGFFGRSFSALRANKESILEMVERALGELESGDFIKYDGMKYLATKFGSRTAELYVVPRTASIIRALALHSEPDAPELLLIFALTVTPDSLVLAARESDEELQDQAAELEEYLPDELIAEYSGFVEDTEGSLKTALVLKDWMAEVPLDVLEKKYSVQPGDVYQLRETYQWLFYSAHRLCQTLRRAEVGDRYYKLSVRVREGIKEELVPLVGLRGIGRVRARILFENGIRSVEDFLRAPEERLLSLPTFGPSVVKEAKKSASSLYPR